MKKLTLSKRTRAFGGITTAFAIGAGISLINDYQNDIIDSLSDKVDEWKERAVDNYESLIELKSGIYDKFVEGAYTELMDKISSTELPF